MPKAGQAVLGLSLEKHQQKRLERGQQSKTSGDLQLSKKRKSNL